MNLESFLAQYQSFGGWREQWSGVPLEFRTCLAAGLPPREFVGSVRALVLREDEVLLVNSAPPILSVGGRCRPGETIEQTLLREVAEETGWLVTPIAVIGFIHCRHLDEQRPNWGRPAPDFIDPMFATSAVKYDPSLLGPDETRSQFIKLSQAQTLNLDNINQTFLREALRTRSET